MCDMVCVGDASWDVLSYVALDDAACSDGDMACSDGANGSDMASSDNNAPVDNGRSDGGISTARTVLHQLCSGSQTR